MKKLVLMVLAVAMILALAACTGGNTNTTTNNNNETTAAPTEPAATLVAVTPEQKNGVYQLTEPGHLLFLAEHPDKEYALCADIDMGGYEWTPIDNFSGTLTGKLAELYNYTISNLTITAAAADTNVGFFRELSGTVKELNFDGVTVTAEGTFTGNMGILTGSLTGKVNDIDTKNCVITVTAKDANIGMIAGNTSKGGSKCVSTGSIQVQMAGGTCYVGGSFGVCTSVISDIESRVAIDVSGNGTAGGAGGIAGNLNSAARTVNFVGSLKVNSDATFAAGALVGNLTKGGIATGYNSASSLQITGATTKDAYLGAAVENATLSDLWTRDPEITMSDAERALRQTVVDYMYRVCTIRWTPSQDMFYTDTCSNNDGSHNQTYYAGVTYLGMPYTHKTGSLERFEYYLNEDGTVKDTVPVNDFGGLLGNDCNDAVYWSWATVSGSIEFLYTGVTICQAGTIPVGGYTVSSLESTTNICVTNGPDKMYEALAAAKMGDAVLKGPGHIRMVAENAYVFRNPNGTINPEKSYLLCHDQGAAFNDKLQSRKSTCKTYTKYTFAELYKTYYIPITIEAFANGKADDLVISTTNTDTTKAGVAKGTVTANYRLNYVKLQITDAAGTKVVDSFYSPDVRDVHVNSLDLAIFQQDVAAAQLVAGQEYTYTVLYGYGDDEAVVQTFKFTA